MTTMESIEEVKSLLSRRWKTMADIAREVGVSRSAVHRVISSKRKSPKTRTVIAEAIDRPISEIWTDEKIKDARPSDAFHA